MCLISEGHVANYTFIAMGGWWLSPMASLAEEACLWLPQGHCSLGSRAASQGSGCPEQQGLSGSCAVPLADPEAPSSSACSQQHKATVYFQAPETPRSLIINLLQGWAMVIAPPASFGRHYFCDLGHSHLPWQTTGRAMTFTNFGIHLSSQETLPSVGSGQVSGPFILKKRDPSPFMAWPARNLLC